MTIRAAELVVVTSNALGAIADFTVPAGYRVKIGGWHVDKPGAGAITVTASEVNGSGVFPLKRVDFAAGAGHTYQEWTQVLDATEILRISNSVALVSVTVAVWGFLLEL